MKKYKEVTGHRYNENGILNVQIKITYHANPAGIWR